MKTVVNLEDKLYPCVTTCRNYDGCIREIDSFRLVRCSSSRVYITTFLNGIRNADTAKQMICKNGIVSIKFDNQSVPIGTYETVNE
jgi:hypothetical protein